MDTEDLSLNLFFKVLKHQFPRIYNEAEKNCWLICVPCSSSCLGLKFTKELFESHILQPSPYFQGEFITLNKKVVEIEENVVKTRKGFTEQREVKIQFEELFYNKAYKAFRVVCLTAPLVGSVQVHPQAPSLTLPEGRSYEECRTFLGAFPVHALVLAKLEREIGEVNRTYVFVPGYEAHAQAKVQRLSEGAQEALLCCNPEFRALHRSNGGGLAGLLQVIESWVVGGLRPVLWAGLTAAYAPQDRAALHRCQALAHLSLGDLGVPAHWHGDFTGAIALMGQIETLSTPLSQLMTLHAISTSLTEAASQASQAAGHQDETLTTDELLPLMVWVLLQQPLPHVQSLLRLLEGFIFAPIGTTALGFTLVTFRAAVQYLLSDSLAPLPPPTSTPPSSVSFPDPSLGSTERKSLPISPPPLIRSVSEDLPSQAPSTLSKSYSLGNVEAHNGVSRNGRSNGTTKSWNTENSAKTVSTRNSETFGSGGNNMDKSSDPMISPRRANPPPEVIPMQEGDLGDFLSQLRDSSLDYSSQNQ